MWKLIEVRPGDSDAIARHRYFDGNASQADYDAYSDWVFAAIERGSYKGYFAVCDGSVVGGAGLNILDWGPTRGDESALRARVVNVFTEPVWRRKGIARSLVAAVLEAADSGGINTISLGATSESRSLYESLGFQAYPGEMKLRR